MAPGIHIVIFSFPSFAQPDVTYDDVGGAGEALEKLREVCFTGSHLVLFAVCIALIGSGFSGMLLVCLFFCLFCFIASQHPLNQLRLQQYTTPTVCSSSKLPYPHRPAIHKSVLCAGHRSTHTQVLLVPWLRIAGRTHDVVAGYVVALLPPCGLLTVAWLSSCRYRTRFLVRSRCELARLR